MFTGLVEEIGTITEVRPSGRSVRVAVRCSRILAGVARGDSIAVDGCCLTVEEFGDWGFSVYASPETMAKTSLGDRRPGDGVNLERALAMGDRLGGHLVTGHVDATGTFEGARMTDDAWEIRIAAPAEILHRSVPKGSITIDGISLTLVELTETTFTCWIIPETWQRTTLARRRPGDRVNLESDLVGKYVFRFFEVHSPSPTAERDARLEAMLQQGGWGAR